VEYWSYDEARLGLKEQVTTGPNGSYDFHLARPTGVLLAKKPGLAPAWKLLNQRFRPQQDEATTLVLTTPGTLSGVVEDEADKPVSGAAVSVAMALADMPSTPGPRMLDYLAGKPARDCFKARTDAAGHFRIENFPTNASANFTVQVPGKALRPSERETGGFDSGGYRTGDDIRLVLEPAATIEGKVVAEGNVQVLPVAVLSLQPDGPGSFGVFEREPVHSAADGTFLIPDVVAGNYHLQARFGTNSLPDWVAETVPVAVETGQALRGVEVKATRGGLLEVAVQGQNDHQPLGQVMVNVYRQAFQSSGESDSKGIARLRLIPGDHQVSAFHGGAPAAQTTATVEAGKTNRAELEIAPPRRITGIVRQPDGQPAEAILVRLVSGFGLEAADARTDAQGKFDLEWSPQRFGPNQTTPCVLVRDTERNLAVAQDVEEDSGPLDLKLAPALTLFGRAECGGKPVTNAAATLVFWTGSSGMYLTGLSRGTNTPGNFEIPALPAGRKYGVLVSAPSYGQQSLNDLDASAEPGRKELEPVELKPANLKLAGQVLDSDDKPIPGAYVNLQGQGQPSANARADRQGRFHFDHVCEGALQVSANSSGSFGNASAQGGDTNVVLRLAQNFGNYSQASAHKLKGRVTDPAGKPVPGVQVAVFPSFSPRWARTGANGTFSLDWSLEPWQVQQSDGPLLVARDLARNLAATEELSEDTTNLDVQLKEALTLAGRVESAEGAPLPGAQVNLWLKTGNSFGQLNEQATAAVANAQGRYEIKGLPADASYLVYATANGRGQGQQQIAPDSTTNCLELSPFVLKVADQLLAGQVLDQDDKPVQGVQVMLNGEGQPNGQAVTDSKGRFHFKVCEGPARLFANSPNGFAQCAGEGGDTNLVLTLNAQNGMVREQPRRASLKGNPLPDLAGLNLPSDALPAGKPVLLCLFDAGQRPSRHAIHQLEEKAAALKEKGLALIGIQAALITDATFNDWKSASPPSFPVGRALEKSAKTKWASDVAALPWLILTDRDHRVVAEGFALEDLDSKLANH